MTTRIIVEMNDRDGFMEAHPVMGLPMITNENTKENMVHMETTSLHRATIYKDRILNLVPEMVEDIKIIEVSP